MSDTSPEIAKDGQISPTDTQRQEAVQRAFEDAMFAFGGPDTRKVLCGNDNSCTKGPPPAHGAKAALYKDLQALEKLDRGPKSRLFSEDLETLNRKLTNQSFGFQITGLDSLRKTVTMKAHGHSYRLANEDGLVTLDSNSGHRTHEINRSRVNLENIGPDDVNQGTLNDCYFLGPACALASVNPEAIRKMIVDHHNGTFTVTFPGDPQHPQTIFAPNRGERSALNKSEMNWVQILEKAHRKLTARSLYDPLGVQETALELLTGKPATSMELYKLRGERKAEELEVDVSKLLLAAIAAKAPIAVASPHEEVEGSHATKWDGITLPHSYAVLAYDEQEKLVTLRNPVGINSADAENFPHIRPGVFKIPLKNFIADFAAITTLKI